MDLKRLAVVTASANGIGLRIAEALMRDGFRVVMSDIDASRGEAEARRLGAEFRLCDARDDRQLQDLFAGLGPVFALINNVGVAGPTQPIHEMDVDVFRDVIEINLTSHFRASQLVIPGMIAAKRGVIVNLSSVAGRIGYANRSPYSASKWAVLGLTRTLAKELGPYGIRANAILPGAVRGDRIERVIQGVCEAEGLDRATAESRLLQRQAIARFIEPEEVADAVAYLVSDRAKAVSGAFVDVNGYFE